MNKRMRELLEQIEQKTAQAKAYLNGETKDVAKSKEIMKEVETLQEEFEAVKATFEAEQKQAAALAAGKATGKANDPEGEPEEDSTKKFAKAIRAIKSGKSYSGMQEGVDADGGYTVPEDIQTQIQQYKSAEFSLLDLVDVETVTTNKGARTFQKKGQKTGFVETDETGAISEIDSPDFERLPYIIKDYTGFMPITNDLFNDSDENLVTVIEKWFADQSRATANRLILNKLKTKGAVAFTGIKSIKTALNVTLGQAYKPTSVIVTNDDGLDYLDQLEDKNGRPLLNPDPTAPTNMQLRCGATVVPVKVIPNGVLTTSEKKVPFIVGDLKEAIKFFDRQKMSLDASTVAAVGTLNAFSQNLTIFRAIEREDVQVKDVDSYVNGYIDVTQASTLSEGN